MKTLILGLNYLPESTSIGPYTADLAEHLKVSGHDVRVVTGFPTAPQWKIWRPYQGRLFMRETIHGVPVLRTYLYVPKNPRKTSLRILFDCSFALSALLGVATKWRPDVVVVISPPLQLAVTGFMIAAFTGARLFLHIQDLVPEAAIAVGALKEGSVVLGLARLLERFAYRRSNAIGVICEGMRRNLISKGVSPEKVVTLPNYIDLTFIRPTANNGFRARHGIGEDEFLAIYSGSVAGKQGLQTFVEAAAPFEKEHDVACCVIGDGPYLPELKETAKNLGMLRFRFLPMQPRELLPEQLAAADTLIITQRKAVRDVVFPGKLLYYMASARPILAAVSNDSETGRFIREHKVGIVVPPEEPARLTEAIRWMQSHREEARMLGSNGRRVAEQHFDRTVVLERFTAYLEGEMQTECLQTI
jgi:colanic acid biosynthesis glycosyl transferase WcaI